MRATYCGKCRHRTLYFRVEKKWIHKVIIYTCHFCGYQFTRKVRRWA